MGSRDRGDHNYDVSWWWILATWLTRCCVLVVVMGSRDRFDHIFCPGGSGGF